MAGWHSSDGQALTPRLAEQSGDQEGSQVHQAQLGERERHLTPLRVGGSVPEANSHRHNTLAPFLIPLLCSLIPPQRAKRNLAQKINPAPTPAVPPPLPSWNPSLWRA
jgi:hypothetical protein